MQARLSKSMSLGARLGAHDVDADRRGHQRCAIGIDVGDDATDVAVGLGSASIASGGNLLEINPASFRVVRTIQVGATPIFTIAVDEDDGSLLASPTRGPRPASSAAPPRGNRGRSRA